MSVGGTYRKSEDGLHYGCFPAACQPVRTPAHHTAVAPERAVRAKRRVGDGCAGRRAGGVVDHKGYYKILGLDASNATSATIAPAFRKAAKLLHPDTNAHKSERAAQRAKRDFAKLQDAYRILKDPAKRKRYDAGSPVDPEVG